MVHVNREFVVIVDDILTVILLLYNCYLAVWMLVYWY